MLFTQLGEKMKKVLWLVILSLTACATPYVQEGQSPIFTGGMTHQWLAPDILSVEAKGNGFTTKGQVSEMALLWAAERALETNYKYFVYIQSTDLSSSSTTYTPISAQTSTFGRIRSPGYGSTAYGSYSGNTYTTLSGGTPITVLKPGVEMVLKMYKDIPEGYKIGQYNDVEKTIAALGPKYINGAGASDE